MLRYKVVHYIAREMPGIIGIGAIDHRSFLVQSRHDKYLQLKRVIISRYIKC